MIAPILIAFAGLMGAGGIALLAIAAHGRPGMGLDSAGQMLLFHSAAIAAIVAVAAQGLAVRPLALLAAAGFAIGAGLFAGDLALRAFAGRRLFPMASPAGGIVLIASWLLLAVSALLALGRF